MDIRHWTFDIGHLSIRSCHPALLGLRQTRIKRQHLDSNVKCQMSNLKSQLSNVRRLTGLRKLYKGNAALFRLEEAKTPTLQPNLDSKLQDQTLLD